MTEFKRSQIMPMLFAGHGSPMNAIEENRFVETFREISKTIEKPNAIICISAHWFIKGTKVGAMEHPRTIHDFSGFPRQLYEIQYPAKGNPELAKQITEILEPVQVEADYAWGLDHGCWTVLKHFYPLADVPVIQISMDYSKPAKYHYELLKPLQHFRNKGILFIGSGNIVHNLSLVDFNKLEVRNYGYNWAHEARDLINKAINEDKHEMLINYNKLGKSVQLAIPTPEHFLPLLYILGLKNENEKIQFFNDELQGGSLSMTSIKIS